MDIEEAVEKATEFLERKGQYFIHRLESIKLDEGIWKVRFDTGIVTKKLVELEIDDKTGRVVKYEESG